MNSFIEIKNLCKVYDAPPGALSSAVFSNINLEVDAGSSLALIGPSGSGKSTLLNLISGLDEPTSGEVLVGGVNVHGLSDEEAACFRNQTIGFVFQSHHLLPALSALENVMIPALAGHGGPQGKDLEERANHLMERVGLAERTKHLPSQLSGGEKQRVAVARALINQPKLLLADEPTGALDQNNAQSLIELLVDLNREQSTTLLVVTHSFQLTEQMMDSRVFEDGQLSRVDS